MENHRLVLPGHLNQYGFLFGGYLLMWVDEVAWMAASLDYPECHFATVGMDDVSFRRSVREGALLRFAADRVHVGNTSVRYSVDVFRDLHSIFTTEVTLVRIDESGVKMSIPRP